MPPKTSKGKSSQPTISTFFAKKPQQLNNKKRAGTPTAIDLTNLDSDTENSHETRRPTKKVKFTTDPHITHPEKTLPVPRRNGNPQAAAGPTAAVPSSEPSNLFRFEPDPRAPLHARPNKIVAGGSSKELPPGDESRRLAFREKFLAKPLPPPAVQRPEAVDTQEEGDGEGEAQPEVSEEEVDDVVVDLRKKFTSNATARAAPKGSKGKGKGKAAHEIGPSGQRYTPLEKQIVQLKRDHPGRFDLQIMFFAHSIIRVGVLLLVEVGYRYR